MKGGKNVSTSLTDKLLKTAKVVADTVVPMITVAKTDDGTLDKQTVKNIKNKTGSDYNAYLTERSRQNYLKSLKSGGSQVLEDLYNQIMNRKSFTYDPASDALYSKYKQIYERQGQKAMEDTMGQAAALTGGYYSSYAQSLGEKQYSSYLSKLNDMIPSFYQKAYDKYLSDGKNLENLYNFENKRLSDETGRLKNIYENEKKTYESALSKEKEKQSQQKAAEEKAKKAAEEKEKKKKSEKEAAEKAKKAAEEKAATAKKKQARENAMLLIKAGKMPDNNTLKLAGISKSEASQLVSYYRSLINKRLYG